MLTRWSKRANCKLGPPAFPCLKRTEPSPPEATKRLHCLRWNTGRLHIVWQTCLDSSVHANSLTRRTAWSSVEGTFHMAKRQTLLHLAQAFRTIRPKRSLVPEHGDLSSLLFCSLSFSKPKHAAQVKRNSSVTWLPGSLKSNEPRRLAAETVLCTSQSAWWKYPRAA